jgi:multiple sugar transport system substrate-binding protein
MKRTISIILSIMLVLAITLPAAAISSTPVKSKATAQPFKGKKINFIGYGAMWTNAMVANLPYFKVKTGITVRFQQLANDQLSNKIAISSAAGGKDLDVIAFRPLQETLLFTKNGWLQPLDSYISKSPDFDIKDIFETAKEVCSTNGVMYGIPTMTEREIVFYNKDMFQKAGIQIPKTMDELMAAAKQLNDPAKGICGIAIRGKGSDAVTVFSGFLRAFGSDFIKNGKAIINTPESIAGFKYYGDLLREYGPKGVSNMGWTETQSLFTQGKAAMRIDADSQYGFAVDQKSSLIYDKVGYFKLPAGPSGSAPFNVVAWCLGISSGSQNKDASWEFINWIMGKEMDAKTQMQGNPSVRTSTWASKNATYNFPAELVKVINETTPVGRGTDRPYMVNVGEARTIIGTVITDAIAGKDVKTSADKANADFQKLLDKEK